MKCKTHLHYYIVICSLFEYAVDFFLYYKWNKFMTDISSIKVCTDSSTTLHFITDAPRYVLNAVKKHDLQVSSVRQELRTYSVTYRVRLEGHPNDLATSLRQQPPHNRRLKRYYLADLVSCF
jgi:hypothetical protein